MLRKIVAFRRRLVTASGLSVDKRAICIVFLCTCNYNEPECNSRGEKADVSLSVESMPESRRQHNCHAGDIYVTSWFPCHRPQQIFGSEVYAGSHHKRVIVALVIVRPIALVYA